jgi:hypothetical protein
LSFEGHFHAGMAMPLLVVEITYQFVIESFIDLDPITSLTNKEDHVLKPIWATSLSFLHDSIDETFPSDYAIIEAMNGSSKPWNDMHHRSYFLPEFAIIEQDDFQSTLSEIVVQVVFPLDPRETYGEGNMVSISPTIMINISCTPGKIENVHISVDCSLEEILIYTELFKEF